MRGLAIIMNIIIWSFYSKPTANTVTSFIYKAEAECICHIRAVCQLHS